MSEVLWLESGFSSIREWYDWNKSDTHCQMATGTILGIMIIFRPRSFRSLGFNSLIKTYRTWYVCTPKKVGATGTDGDRSKDQALRAPTQDSPFSVHRSLLLLMPSSSCSPRLSPRPRLDPSWTCRPIGWSTIRRPARCVLRAMCVRPRAT